jgi:hypothetical protein
MYEPYIDALATYFQVGIPPWIAAERRPDNWQGNIQAPRSAAERRGEGYSAERKRGAFLAGRGAA